MSGLTNFTCCANSLRRAGSLLLMLAVGTILLHAQTGNAADKTSSSAALSPGKGLAQHDFFYAGESKNRRMFIVKKGAIVWSYDDPAGKGEISDAVLLSNGNVLFAHQFAVTEITPDKKVVWNYDAPAGSEIHTAQPIGLDRVLFIQNGDPALLRVVNISTGKVEKEMRLTVANPKSVHGQFRHARLTANGTLMVAHMDMGKVCEYDENGAELWSFPAQGLWGVTPLRNGNVLITDSVGVREINRRGDAQWAVTRAEISDYNLTNLQQAWRLPNGNTVLDNWTNEWQGAIDKSSAPVQVLELTPDKKVVWALRSWTDPNDLGPATTIQFLDGGVVPEDVHFGTIH